MEDILPLIKDRLEKILTPLCGDFKAEWPKGGEIYLKCTKDFFLLYLELIARILALHFHGSNLQLSSYENGQIWRITTADLTSESSLNEALQVLICKKCYYQDLIPEQFLNADIEKSYNGEDYHRMYVGEIVKTLKQ